MLPSRHLLGLAALVLACICAAEQGGTTHEQQSLRFPDTEALSSSRENATELLCHRLHLMPVGSPAHRRALAGCPQQPSLPKTVKDPPGSVGSSKDKYKNDFDKQRNDLIDAKKNRKPTPEEDAALKALDKKHADLKKLQDEYNVNAAKRKDAQAKDDAQAKQDTKDKSAQWDSVVKDDIKKVKYDADAAAAEADKVRDALDAKKVDAAKAKLKEFEDAIMDAKAKAASDPKIIKDLDEQITKMKARRKADEEQRAQDELQAQQDKNLADSAEKRKREQERAARAKERENNANEFDATLVRARTARDDALKRKKLLQDEDAKRAMLRRREKDAEDALMANRKRREQDAVERQKRMDEYKKDEPNIKQRRKDYDDAEAKRAKRAKDREDARLKREKDAADEKARLKRAKENDVPPEERPKRDNEEDCKDKAVNCGSGKCFQLKDDPKSKRCQCQPGDKGKNCELKGCEYDVADGAGRAKRQRGSKVSGECVRWKAVYRCKCDKPWRLDVTCVTSPAKGSSKEKEVPDQKCKGLRKPKNQYAKHTCSLCTRSCRGPRRLEHNETAVAPHRALASEPADTVTAADINAFKLTCNKRMVANSRVAFSFASKKADLPASGGRMLAATPKLNGSKPPHSVVKNVKTFLKCQEICLKRDGGTGTGTGGRKKGATAIAKPATHCTWVWYDMFNKYCYVFTSGAFPDDPISPPKNPMIGSPTPPPARSGFVAFVAYPRRFNIYRSMPLLQDTKDFDDYRVVFGGSSKKEDDVTFAFKTDGAHALCVANEDTIRETALAYQTNVKPKARLTKLPSNWATGFGEVPSDVTVKPSGVATSWTYKFDRFMRVTEVSGVSIATRKGKRVDKQFDTMFGTLTRQAQLTKAMAPFAPGQLVAYEQKPPNFFFNYVPQHENSNTLGCWRDTESAMLTFLELGCELKVVVRVDYGKNGKILPTQVRDAMPEWAQQHVNRTNSGEDGSNGEGGDESAAGDGDDGQHVEENAEVRDSDGENGGEDGGSAGDDGDSSGDDGNSGSDDENPGDDGEVPGGDDGDVDDGDGGDDDDDGGDDSGSEDSGSGSGSGSAAADKDQVYVNDRLFCHYRFRPYTMSIDFSIKGSTAKTKMCHHLYAGIGNGFMNAKLLDVTRDEIQTTRVKAYLLQKQSATRGATNATSLQRLLQVATTMYKTSSDLMCYAETGNTAPFKTLRMDFNFKLAFLESLKPSKCLRFEPPAEEKAKCDKWSMASADKAQGELHRQDGKCILSDNGTAVLGEPSSECASFKYLFDTHVFNVEEVSPKLDLGAGDGADKDKVESLILGTVVVRNGDVEECLRADLTFGVDECWIMRIGYYPSAKKTK
ncbi:hypothetical protein ATCC90586_005869 [Pythium insidiosum]|nr:hypothetical protein ATCC90586_005869 [Pythium insidiosum]